MTCPRSLDSLSSSVAAPGDDDGLADVADLERQVDAQARVDRHLDVLRFGRREALQLGAHGVAADPDVLELVVALVVADRVRDDAGADVLQGHGRARDDGAGGVAHRAEHAGGVELSEGAGGRRQDRDDGREREAACERDTTVTEHGVSL